MRKESNRWFNSLDKDNIKSEEELALWLNPSLEGYQGMLAFINLIDNHKTDTVKLKKNIPVIKTSMSSKEFNSIVFDFINDFDYDERPRVSLLVQAVIRNFYDGSPDTSVRDLARCLKLSKSSIHNIISILRKNIKSRYI
jgi:hypothetical protein